MTPLEGPVETAAEHDARQGRELEEARRRTRATFAQGLLIDVGVAVAVTVLAGVDSITDRAGVILLLVSIAKSVATAIATFIVRRYVKPVDPAAG